MLASTTPAASSYSSKRQSLNLSNGPRPLQLVDMGPKIRSTPLTSSNVPSPILTESSPNTGPDSSPTASTPSSNSPRLSNPRRQSSISYNTSQPDRPFSFHSRLASPPLSAKEQHRHSLSRSLSYAGHGAAPSRGRATRNSEHDLDASAVPEECTLRSEEKERPPLTMAEKHADLLRFIAQKESKCLELRSQLAAHEAELSQLKRKWERIVSRGMERENPTHTGETRVERDPLVEGIQGVGRFIAASYGGFSTTPTVPTHTRTATSSTTAASSSTRLSQSSTSTLVSEAEDLPATRNRKKDRPKSFQMSHNDTGASPLVSPNLGYAPPGEDNKRHEDAEKERQNSNRISMPGLGEWVGSMVGKKWEERITKEQRRASTLFTDLTSALSSPHPITPSLSSGSGTTNASSILDEDVPSMVGEPLVPTPSPTNSDKVRVTKPTPMKVKSRTVMVDEEDEWNW